MILLALNYILDQSSIGHAHSMIFFDQGSFYYVSISLHRVDTIILKALCIAGCTQPTKFKESTNTLVLIMIATVVQKSALGNNNKPLASLQCKTYSSCSPCITLVRKLSCCCKYTSTFVLCELNMEYLTCRDEYYYCSIFEPCP